MAVLKFSQVGDTIVEVLVAIAVLSVVLAGAYVTSNRSLNAELNAQEHTQALTIAQGQVEDLYSGDQLCNSSGLCGNCFNPQTPNVFNVDNCYIGNNGTICITVGLSSSCHQTPTPSFWYTIDDSRTIANIVTVPPLTSNVYTYQIDVNWPAITGDIGSVQLYYRNQ